MDLFKRNTMATPKIKVLSHIPPSITGQCHLLNQEIHCTKQSHIRFGHTRKSVWCNRCQGGTKVSPECLVGVSTQSVTASGNAFLTTLTRKQRHNALQKGVMAAFKACGVWYSLHYTSLYGQCTIFPTQALAIGSTPGVRSILSVTSSLWVAGLVQ